MNHKGVGAFHFTPSAFHQSEVPILPARWRAEGVKKKQSCYAKVDCGNICL